MGEPGVLHGSLSYLLQDPHGQINEAHSISAGLDYPGVGPEHSWLKDKGRVNYLTADDHDALDAFRLVARTEGILPALEPAHALARAFDLARELGADRDVLVNLSGRGDKDVEIVAAALRRSR
jgi:tryptophan synthase beta chain